jgi:hypothetical protein
MICCNTARLTDVETLHVTSLQGFHALRFLKTYAVLRSVGRLVCIMVLDESRVR